MRNVYIVNLDLEVKSGLFSAIHNRAKLEDENTIFYNLIYKDSKVLSFFKKITKKKIVKTKINEKTSYVDGVKYNNIIINTSIIKKILCKLGMEKIVYKSIIKKLDIQKTDFIIAHWGYPHGRVAYFINKIKKNKYIVYYHGSDINYIAPRYKKEFKEVMSAATTNIFVSKGLYEKAKESNIIINKNFYITKNGIDTEIFNYDGNISKANKIGFVGNLEPVKRAGMLPEIFKEISRKFPDIEFEIIGAGSLEHVIQEKIKKYNLKVKLYGHIGAKEVANALKNMKILILPSENEAWGSVVIEANACGTYVIATSVGGLKESVGDYGSLIPNEINYLEENISKEINKVLKSKINIEALVNRGKNYGWHDILLDEKKFMGF